MTLGELKTDLLQKLWLEDPAAAPANILPDIASAINRAYQILWLSPEDYFRSETITVNTAADVASVALPAGVQEILGQVKIGANYLTPLASEGDAGMAANLYPGAGVGTTPIYYYPQRTRTADADNVAVSLLLYPTPASVLTVSLEVANEAPSYTVAELTSLEDNDLPIPHNYAESYLQPIARKCVMSSHFFWDKDKAPGLEADYQAALASLGMADPFRGHNPEPKEEATA